MVFKYQVRRVILALLHAVMARTCLHGEIHATIIVIDTDRSRRQRVHIESTFSHLCAVCFPNYRRLNYTLAELILNQ